MKLFGGLQIIKTTKEKEYLEYINEHKVNIHKSFDFFKQLLLNLSIEDLDKYLHIDETRRDEILLILKVNCVNHDMSKYCDEEFDNYRRKFYYDEDNDGMFSKEIIEHGFEYSWIHHYSSNLHHPEYWGISDSKMPIEYQLEMLIDWYAMSIKFNSSIKDYYTDKKPRLEAKFKNILDFELIEFILSKIL